MAPRGASREWLIPITLPRTTGGYTQDRFTAPIIPESAVPGLLGLKSMMNHRVVLDLVNKRMIMCGPGQCEIKPPPGSEVYQLEQAPSGHLLLPISDYDALQKYRATRDRLEAQPDPISLPVLSGTSSSSSSVPPVASTPGFPGSASHQLASGSGIPDTTAGQQ